MSIVFISMRMRTCTTLQVACLMLTTVLLRYSVNKLEKCIHRSIYGITCMYEFYESEMCGHSNRCIHSVHKSSDSVMKVHNDRPQKPH